MQGQSQRGGLRGGRRGFGGPSGGDGDKQDKGGQNKQNFSFNPNIFGPPKQTPKTSLAIPNLGLQFSNPSIGSPQGIANLGTVNTGAGFNFGGDGAGKQGGLNQDFTPQVGPPPTSNIPARQGIDTIQTSSPSFGPLQKINTLQQLQALNFLDFYGEDPFSDMDLSAYDSNMSFIDSLRMNPTFSNIENVFDTVRNPQLETGIGTFNFDPLDPTNVGLDTSFGQFQFNIDDDPFVGFTMPLGK